MPVSPSVVLPRRIPQKTGAAIRIAPLLLEAARSDTEKALQKMQTSATGLTAAEVERRHQEYGPNVVAQEQHYTRLRLLGKAMVNPLVILLLTLALISYVTDTDGTGVRAAVVMLLMVVLGVVLRFIQETAPTPRRPSSKP